MGNYTCLTERMIVHSICASGSRRMVQDEWYSSPYGGPMMWHAAKLVTFVIGLFNFFFFLESGMVSERFVICLESGIVFHDLLIFVKVG